MVLITDLLSIELNLALGYAEYFTRLRILVPHIVIILLGQTEGTVASTRPCSAHSRAALISFNEEKFPIPQKIPKLQKRRMICAGSLIGPLGTRNGPFG